MLHPPYDAFVSTGAAGAIQMLEIVRHAVGQYDNAGQVCLAGTRLLVDAARLARGYRRGAAGWIALIPSGFDRVGAVRVSFFP